MAHGYAYAGFGTLAPPPVVAAPASVASRISPVRKVTQVVAVDGIASGRPALSVTSETRDDWCDYMRVTINGKDVTFLRGGLTIAANWQGTDPYGDSNASIIIPTVTAFEAKSLTSSWLYEGARVRVEAVKNGVVVNPVDPDFLGMVDSIDRGASATTLECSGRFSGWASSMMFQPSIMDRAARDSGTIVWGMLEPQGKFRVLPHGGPSTGIMIGGQGSRDMTVLGRFDDVIGRTITEDGTSWTLMPDRVAGPQYLRYKQRPNDLSAVTPDFTVYLGAHGITLGGMKRDRIDMVTTVYGEGVSPDGGRWQNKVFPLEATTTPTFPGTMSLGSTGAGVTLLAQRLWTLGLLRVNDVGTQTFDTGVQDGVEEFQRRYGDPITGVVDSALWDKLYGVNLPPNAYRAARFMPLSVDPKVMKFIHGAGGVEVALNPSYDPNFPQQEVFVGYGDHVTKQEARNNARALRHRGGDINGTLTLTSDPVEMSRFAIREGMVGEIANLYGSGARVYVSSRQVDWASGTQPVTLAVSTSAKHYLELAQIIQRNVDARRDPAKQARHQFRRSTQAADTMIGWESEGMAGVIPSTPITANTWTPIQFIAAEAGTIGDFNLTLDTPCEFYVYLFASQFSVAGMNSVIGDPSVWANSTDKVTKAAENLAWLQDPSRLFIEGWGTPDEPLGYGQKRHTNDAGHITAAPLVGWFRDQGTWTFESPSAYLWLGVYAKANTTINGRAKVVRTDAP